MSKKTLIILIFLVLLSSGAYLLQMEKDMNFDELKDEFYFAKMENFDKYTAMPKNTRERYIASYGVEDDTSFKVAEEKIDLKEKEIAYSENEEVRYKTIEEDAGSILMGNDSEATFVFRTEMKYVVNKEDGSFKSVEDLGVGELFVFNEPEIEFTGGGYNINVEGDYLRISQTGQAHFKSLPNAEVGRDIVESYGDYARSKIKTLVIEIPLVELEN